jgi:hypothetical protein
VGVGKFLLVIIVFAALVYAAFYLLERRRGRGGGRPAPRRSTPRRPTPRNLAPDDDEDFLRDLNRRNRKDRPKNRQQDPDTPGE